LFLASLRDEHVDYAAALSKPVSRFFVRTRPGIVAVAP